MATGFACNNSIGLAVVSLSFVAITYIFVLIIFFVFCWRGYIKYGLCKTRNTTANKSGHGRRQRNNPSATMQVKVLNFVNALFFICTLLAIASQSRLFFRVCYLQQYIYLGVIGLAFTAMSVFLFDLNLYLRLKLIFHGSAMQLSTLLTKFLFPAYFAIYAFLWLSLVIYYARFPSDSDDDWPLLLLSSVIVLLHIIVSMFLTYMFTSKLYALMKMNAAQHGRNKKTQSVLALIAKCFVLEVIADMAYIAMAVWLVIASAVEMSDVLWFLVTGILSLFDMVTNFCCIYLSLKVNATYFNRFCGPMSECSIHWLGKRGKMKEADIEMSMHIPQAQEFGDDGTDTATDATETDIDTTTNVEAD